MRFLGRGAPAARVSCPSPVTLFACFACAGLPESHAGPLSQLWRKNLMDLSLGALGTSLTVNELVDMEWSFGVTVASDELETVRFCFLCLCLCFVGGFNLQRVRPLCSHAFASGWCVVLANQVRC